MTLDFVSSLKLLSRSVFEKNVCLRQIRIYWSILVWVMVNLQILPTPPHLRVDTQPSWIVFGFLKLASINLPVNTDGNRGNRFLKCWWRGGWNNSERTLVRI